MKGLISYLKSGVPALAANLQGPGNEADFRQEFLEGLRRSLRDDGLEPIIQLEKSNLKGRTDARIEYFIFEFKSPGELKKSSVRSEGLKKLQGYLESQASSDGTKYRGLLTDGIQAAILVFHPGAKRHVYVDATGVPLPTGKELLAWDQVTNPLSHMIASMALPHLNSDSLLYHFGFTTDLCKDTLKALWKQLRAADTNLTKLLFDQWRELFALAVEFSVTDKPGEDLVELFQMGGGNVRKEAWDEAVFVVHTYYSFLLKLLALRIVDELGLGGPVSLLDKVASYPTMGMLEAEETIPKVLGNVIEKDVFSWPYCDPESPPTLAVSDALAHMARKMQTFDVQGVRTDILRHVYQKIIPPKLRKSLGEFYTPTWAAELLLDNIEYNGQGRLLDPTCGSGTFLVAAIQRLIYNIDASPIERLTLACKNIVGYDLNPIAVATARLSFTLALVDTILAGHLPKPLAIPVYLSDSLLLPEKTSPFLSPYFQITTHVGTFQVPMLYPEKPEDEIVEDTRKLLRILREHCKKDLDTFLKTVRREMGTEAEENNKSLLIKLHRKIRELHVGKQDGIWTSIIESFFAPILQGRFDFVVGNPPWVIPRRTPKNYTNKVREAIAETLGDEIVLKPATRDFTVLKTRSSAAEQQYFACTPFVWRAFRTYATDGGKIAFLMTSSMFSSLGSGGWRRWITRYDLLKIIDLTLLTDIHEGALCWSYIPVFINRPPENKAIKYSFCIPGTEPNMGDWDVPPRDITWKNWEIRYDELPVTESRILAGNGSRQPSESPWLVAPPDVIKLIRKIQKKAEEANRSYARLGDLYPMHMGFKADGWKYFAFKDIPSVENGIARGYNHAGEKVKIEAEFVFPTAVARNFRPWTFSPSFAFLPLHPNGTSVGEKELRNHDLTWQYLMEHKLELSSRAVVKKGYVDDWYGILVPSAVKSKAKVAFRLINKQLEALVLPLMEDFDNKRKILLPDQSVRFIPMTSIEEANYTTALMNSIVLRCISYLCATPKGGIPWRAFKGWNMGFLPIIRFNPSISRCRDIAKLGGRLGKNPNEWNESREMLDELVGGLYGISKKELEVLECHFSMMQGRGHNSEENIENITDDEEE